MNTAASVKKQYDKIPRAELTNLIPIFSNNFPFMRTTPIRENLQHVGRGRGQWSHDHREYNTTDFKHRQKPSALLLPVVKGGGRGNN